MKNITLSAEADLIERARLRAQQEQTTLNAAFREWLAEFAGSYQDREQIQRMFAQFDRFGSGGRKFTRDEMNER